MHGWHARIVRRRPPSSGLRRRVAARSLPQNPRRAPGVLGVVRGLVVVTAGAVDVAVGQLLGGGVAHVLDLDREVEGLAR